STNAASNANPISATAMNGTTFCTISAPFHLAQHSLAIVAERTREQLLFVIHGNHIGALGGRQHGDNDANDRNRDNDAHRHDHAQTSAVPTGVLPRVGSMRTSNSRHDESPLKRPAD